MIAASLLYSFATCPHRVALDLHGDPSERDEISPFVKLLWERGSAFELETIEKLGIPFLNLRDVPRIEREGRTTLAILSGENLIYGGRISHGLLLGEPDLLRKTDNGYIPGDIKSGAGLEGGSEDVTGKPKRHYALQLALYSDILQARGWAHSKYAFVWDIHGQEAVYQLEDARGPRMPHTMWEEYEDALETVQAIAAQTIKTDPALIGACKLCHWRTHCRRQINQSDDLTLISELGRSRRDRFPPEIRTVRDLANATLDSLTPGGKSVIPGIGARTLQLYHARAVLQRQQNAQPYFLAPVALPTADTELFFDVETDPLRDLCYLHGFVKRTKGGNTTEEFIAFTADEPTGELEKTAFADAWRFVNDHADAIVYYFSPYERTTWKNLARRYPDVASEDDIQGLFEQPRFVDLYQDIVRSKMIWPTHSLSIKTLASFLGFQWRDTDPSGAASVEWFHQWVKTGDPAIWSRILEYNEDDCRAMRVLVDALLPGMLYEVPQESRNQMNRAGVTLLAGLGNDQAYARALDLVERWRMCHAYPMNALYQAVQRRVGTRSADVIVSQRLKRMPSIIEKLQRQSTMKLPRMQDIGGVRAVFPTVDGVYRFFKRCLDGAIVNHELARSKDYITAPRDRDGYRGVHLIYKFHDRVLPSHDGLSTELQIRTRLQHIWATAVETVGTFLEQDLKSGQGESAWLDFFALTSCAFAHVEGTTAVPRFASLSKLDVFRQLAEAERDLGALRLMDSIPMAAEAIVRDSAIDRDSHHYLLVLDWSAQSVETRGFQADDLDEAMREYERVEEETGQHAYLKAVLVSVTSVDELRLAYPSFFMDINEFTAMLSKIIDSVTANSAFVDD